MSRALFIAAILLGGSIDIGLHAQSALSQENLRLLPDVTQQAIQALPAKEVFQSDFLKDPLKGQNIDDQKTLQFSVTADQLPTDAPTKLQFNADGMTEVPIAAPNSVIIQFEPGTTEAEVSAFLAERQLEIIRKFPSIRSVQAEGDLSRYFMPELSDDNANDALLRGMVDIVEDFKSDPRIKNATPDLFLRDQDNPETEIVITNLLTPSDVVLSDAANPIERADWGIADIEADQLWSLDNARDGVLFGVMDVGFSRHEDLVFMGLSPRTDVDDHGNHVAAIGCGRHDNAVGVKGVLPNCFVRARSGDIFFNADEGGQVLEFFVLFSQVLATLENFVSQQDEVLTFNISLGYNWRGNFGINPDLPDAAQWRTLVASQGAILVPLLELADRNGRVIFSAAGNDSTGLETPISARFASPFNWAALEAREQGIANSGVIVEAHDSNGNRAPFSNTGGHISCPGVDIFSAVAFDITGQFSRNAYGSMSGTSMASPYCASGHLLFRLVRSGYTGNEALECMLQSTDMSSSGTPMLRLQQAITNCPPKP
ncbi:S8 family peptidase [Roseovarius arcticus]|uniref:S8 family peptidase n=1 Tax=Roseovarius arcticus TaxID=2547404 RepID=UPI0011103CE0|nr:S8 family serine peptidase [Roseovarius arcticus]